MQFLPDVLARLQIGRSASYVANKGNAGDALIAASTGLIVEQMEIEVRNDAPVVLVAGGGGLHPAYECLAKAIAKIPRDRTVVVLPSTVSAHWELLGSFRRLTLLARDEMTHALARMNGINSILCHDAAFSFDFSGWKDEGEGTLHALRTDIESAGREHPEDNRDISVMAGGWWPLHGSLLTARKFVTAISGYRTIMTDRLHVAIVGAKLGKRVIFKPCSYFKNRAVFEMSLERFPDVTFVLD